MDRAECIDEFRDRLLSTIVSCQNCQPWEKGPVWVIGKRTELEEVIQLWSVARRCTGKESCQTWFARVAATA